MRELNLTEIQTVVGGDCQYGAPGSTVSTGTVVPVGPVSGGNGGYQFQECGSNGSWSTFTVWY